MAAKLRLGLIGVDDGQELEAALGAEHVEVSGFWGENQVLMSELAAHYGLLAVASWHHLATADALYVGPRLSSPAQVLTQLATWQRPLLLSSALLACEQAEACIAPLLASSGVVNVARAAAVDDGLAYCRSLAQGGLLGSVLGATVRVASADRDAAWVALADELGTALWVSGLEPRAARWSSADAEGALAVTALIECGDGASLSVQMLAGVPGGAHDDLLAPRILGSRAQLILAREPLGWFVAASESNVGRRWEKLVYAGLPGSLGRIMDAFARAVLADETPLSPLTGEVALVRLIAAMRRTGRGDWPAD